MSNKRIKSVPHLAARPVDGHKGTFGRVLIISGSVGMAGAPALVGSAALRSGAGLVTIAVPESIACVVAGLCPCATTIALPVNKSGQIKPSAAAKTLRARGWIGERSKANPPDALVVGPGIGTGTGEYAERWWDLIDAFRIESLVPAVIDADALNLAALLPNGWEKRPHPRTVFTPHPGELARMLIRSTVDVQADRETAAVDTAQRLGAQTDPADRSVLVLKGAGTLVTDGESVFTNKSGNPGMATGGSGDVLSGIIGALLAQGLSPFDAAALAVHVHGVSGDLAAERFGQVSMIATDIVDALPEAFKRLSANRSKAGRKSSRKKAK